MQEKWFQKISTSGRDFYYIIEYQGKEIGCINIRDVDFEKGEGEPGIFIWDDVFLLIIYILNIIIINNFTCIISY